jgi:two-component system, sensor histidine kinase YesM
MFKLIKAFNYQSLKKNKMLHLFYKNMLITSILILIPVSLLIINTYYISFNLVLKNIYEINSKMVNKIADNTENHINSAIQKANALAQDAEILDFAIDDARNLTYDEIMSAVDITSRLKAYQSNKGVSTDFEIYYLDENYCINSKGSGFLINKGGDLLNWDNISLNSFLESDSQFEFISGNLFFLTRSNSPQHSLDRLITAKISNIEIENIIKTYTDNKYFFMNSDKSIFFKDNYFEYNENIYNDLLGIMNTEANEIISFDGSRYIVTTSDLSLLGLKCVIFVPLAEYYREIRKSNRAIILLIAASLVGIIILSFFITLQLLRPMESIITIMKSNETESLNVSQDTRLSEIEHIASNIIQYKQDNKRLSKELLKRIDIANKAQMYALQAQINPHFLYNTLDSISWDAMQLTKGENTVSKNIQLLSRLMRTGLEGASLLVPLKEEIEHAKLYLELYKNRSTRQIETLFDIDPQVETFQVVKLTLQPIVENAIYHGLKDPQIEGQIVITGKKIDNKLQITISDNGAGIEKPVLDELNRKLNQDTLILNDHIGLGNVNLRLKLFFGNDFGIHIESEYGRNTEVILTLPILT